MNRREIIKLGVSAAAVSAVAPMTALSQSNYPTRPIRLVVPFSAGGVVDTIGRLWADGVSKDLGTVVVENLGGAGGTIGAGEAARAEPNGYTVLLGNTSTQILNPVIMANAPYDPDKDFQTVSIVALSTVCIAVSAKVPAKSLKELVAYVKANPGKVSYGSPGTGTFTHLAGEMFKHITGITDFTHVPYKGAGPGINDLISGHIPAMALNVTRPLVALHKSGKIRILAVLADKPLDVLPDVPTGTDTVPGLVAQLFTGVFVPTKTPSEVVERLGSANAKAVANEGLRTKLEASGLEVVTMGPAESQKFVDAERTRLLPLVKEIGFKIG